MSVLVVGSVAYDTVETPFGKADDALGGSAMFFSAAASLFSPVRVVAVVGDDFNKKDLSFLEQRHVDFDGLEVQKGKTFRWGGKYDYDLNTRETLFTHLNVFENFAPKLPDEYKDTEYIFLANIQPALQLSVLEQVQNPKLVVLDTMNYWIERTYDDLVKALKKVDVLVINDSEARQLADEPNLVQAVKIIQGMGPKILVIKKGEHGAMMVTPKTHFWAPAYPLEKLADPTGAGDTFAGGFVGYLAKQNDLSEFHLRSAIIHGSVVASYCVEQFSADRLKTLSNQEIEKRFDEFIQMTKVSGGDK